MRITTTKATTVAALRALLEGHDGTEEVTFSKASAKAGHTGECWCGCGGATKSRFVPGHDARFHSLAKQVARDLADLDESLADLPHQEAQDEFLECVEKERPLWAAKQATKKTTKKPVITSEREITDEVPGETGELDPESEEFKALLSEMS